MKTSHWSVIAAFAIPIANQFASSVCGHNIDVTQINYLSIASEIFAIVIGSADWYNRNITQKQQTDPVDVTKLVDSVQVQKTPQIQNIFIDKIVAVNGQTKNNVILTLDDYTKLKNYTGTLFVSLPYSQTRLPANTNYNDLHSWIVSNDPTHSEVTVPAQTPSTPQTPVIPAEPQPVNTLPNGFTFNVSWVGTDQNTGLPTLKQGDLVYVGVQKEVN